MRTRQWIAGLFGLLWVGAVASPGFAQTVVDTPVVNDTFIDSSAAGYPVTVGNTTYDEQSYGADGKVKVVSAAAPNGNSSGQSSSATHVLFQIPASIISDWNSGLVSSVTVNYYAYNNSLTLANPNDGDDVIDLYPLTHIFTVGNGVQPPKNTPDAPPNTSTTGGATWATYDGDTADTWTTPGGDYLSTISPVVDSNGSNEPNSVTGTGPYVPFTWDITSLLKNSTDEFDLANYGALLRLPLDPSQVPSGTQDFASLNSANATSYTPFFAETFVPEPAAATTALALVGLGLLRRRSRRKFSPQP